MYKEVMTKKEHSSTSRAGTLHLLDVHYANRPKTYEVWEEGRDGEGRDGESYDACHLKGRYAAYIFALETLCGI